MEIDSTIRCRTASMANSFGVQCVTGNPKSFGGRQASARICVNCSAENLGGTPHRSPSAMTPSSTRSNSSSETSGAQAAHSFSCAAANRRRQRLTRCWSTPKAVAWSTLDLSSADQRTTCTRSASRRSSFRDRASRSRIARERSLNTTAWACRDMPPA
jgi:hypothetical protein